MIPYLMSYSRHCVYIYIVYVPSLSSLRPLSLITGGQWCLSTSCLEPLSDCISGNNMLQVFSVSCALSTCQSLMALPVVDDFTFLL